MVNLAPDIFQFISLNKERASPPLLDPSLQSITSIAQAFEQHPKDTQNIIKLAKYFAFYENYTLSTQLLNWGSTLYPDQHQYHYFQAILDFKCNNIAKTLSSIEKMLCSMKASATQIKHILNRLNDENKKNDCIFFIDNLLEEFNLPSVPRDFNILILPYDLKDKNQITRYYYSVYFIQLCNILQWIDGGQLTKLLDAEYKINQSTPWYHLCMGKLYWILHDRKQTDFHFQTARKLSIEQNLIFTTINCGVYTWLSDEEIQKLPPVQESHDPFQLKMWQWSYADLKGEKPEISIILGCDFKYFMYFPKFLFSLLESHIQNHYQKKTVVSICLDNPSPEQMRFLHNTTDYIHQHIPHFHLTFGYGLYPYQDGAYFASIRYLFAPELFERYPTQTFIVDIDACVESGFYKKVKAMKENYDFALRIFAFDQQGNQISGEPWCLGAGILYLRDLEKTQSILQFLKQYITYAYTPKNPLNWCIDQCALAQAFEYYIRPFWDKLRVMDIDHNPPFLLSHVIGDKDEFYRHNGVIDIDNFKEKLQQLLH